MTAALGFGYLYDFRNPAAMHRSWTDLYNETLDVIAWSENAGFEGAWIPEHHVAEDGYIPVPNIVLAAIAARTNTIRLGSAVALAPLHHPVRFAEECAVLDIISGGRLDVGLAIGYRRRETDSYGVDFSKRGSRFDEFLKIVLSLWAGERVTFEGQHFTVRDAWIMPRPRGHIPLYIGGFSEKAMDRVVEYGDGYFGNEEACDLYFEKLRQRGKKAGEARIRIPALYFTVAREPARAMEELAPYYHHVTNAYGAWAGEDNALGIDRPSFRPMSLDEFKASGLLTILTPEQAVVHLTALRDRIGLEHLMMMKPPGLPAERFVEYAEVFASEVIPAFR
jgi:alkanesulfonate monooxygenase SsuD/methylene tetrahydromethanopterin reductase-like flavin-dependent oxidoreductase (luciferase family)